jgi:hypothetical protein
MHVPPAPPDGSYAANSMNGIRSGKGQWITESPYVAGRLGFLRDPVSFFDEVRAA